MSFEFLLTSLVVVLVPGTGVIYTTSMGLLSGARASIAAAFGCTLGIIPHITACVLGLAALLHVSAVAFNILKMAGVAYLIFLAWSMWRDTGSIDFMRGEPRRGLGRVVFRGFLINILNPKLSIFFLAFLPQFVYPKSEWPMGEMLLLSAVFMGMTLFFFILYGLAANSVRGYVANSPRSVFMLKRSFAAIFALLGLRLALAER